MPPVITVRPYNRLEVVTSKVMNGIARWMAYEGCPAWSGPGVVVHVFHRLTGVGYIASQCVDGRLRPGIDSEAREGQSGGAAGYVDDGAARLEHLGGGLDAPQGALEVDGRDEVHLSLGFALDRRRGAGHGRVVDEHVEMTPFLNGSSHEGLDLGLHGDVGAEDKGLASGLFDVGHHGLGRLTVLPSIEHQQMARCQIESKKELIDQSNKEIVP